MFFVTYRSDIILITTNCFVNKSCNNLIKNNNFRIRILPEDHLQVPNMAVRCHFDEKSDDKNGDLSFLLGKTISLVVKVMLLQYWCYLFIYLISLVDPGRTWEEFCRNFCWRLERSSFSHLWLQTVIVTPGNLTDKKFVQVIKAKNHLFLLDIRNTYEAMSSAISIRSSVKRWVL